MKDLYTHYFTKILMIALFLFGWNVHSQDIHFSFKNAQNTNDGSFDYYEVDVMIQTINSTGTFKLGSGQLYFLYNTAAFGSNIDANGSFEVTFANPDYICGQYIDAAAANIYGAFTQNDNTTNRVSWAFSQTFSSSTFADDNVTEIPAKLCHIKVKYVDMGQDPMFLLEDGGTYDDQFYTACGSAGGGLFDTADCGGYPGTQLLNDTFDSSGATLSTNDLNLAGLSIYPNPTKGMLYIYGKMDQLKSVNIYSFTGQHVMEVKSDFEAIDLGKLPSAIYFVKLDTEETTGTFKIIKE